jgi:hypothetical protein
VYAYEEHITAGATVTVKCCEGCGEGGEVLDVSRLPKASGVVNEVHESARRIINDCFSH